MFPSNAGPDVVASFTKHAESIKPADGSPPCTHCGYLQSKLNTANAQIESLTNMEKDLRDAVAQAESVARTMSGANLGAYAIARVKQLQEINAAQLRDANFQAKQCIALADENFKLRAAMREARTPLPKGVETVE